LRNGCKLKWHISLGYLGAIFFKAQNKIQDPAKLSRLVQLIDAESWVGMTLTPRATCTKTC